MDLDKVFQIGYTQPLVLIISMGPSPQKTKLKAMNKKVNEAGILCVCEGGGGGGAIFGKIVCSIY